MADIGRFLALLLSVNVGRSLQFTFKDSMAVKLAAISNLRFKNPMLKSWTAIVSGCYQNASEIVKLNPKRSGLGALLVKCYPWPRAAYFSEENYEYRNYCGIGYLD